MHIDHVSYERKIADGSYGNRMLHISASVGEDDDPEEVIAALRATVEGKLAEAERQERHEREAEQEIIHLDHDIARKKRELEEMKAIWERAKAFLEQAGVDVRGRYGEEPW